MNHTESTNSVSVVVASIVGGAFLDACLTSLEDQVRALDAQVLVVSCGNTDEVARLRRCFPWVKVHHHPKRETIPALRRLGVRQASGGVVAIIEEHCTADAGWLSAALDAHRSGHYGAVGGAVADHAYERLVDWTVYFCEYSISLPPAPTGLVAFLNGANIAYRRDVLLAYDHLLANGYWEATLHPVLLADGVQMLSVPSMVIRHRGPFAFGYYLRQRYWFSRAFAGSRATRLATSQRFMYCTLAPLLPLLLLIRIGSRVWRKRCRPARFVAALPLIVPALAVYVAGECVGYASGPGDALSRVE